MRGSTQLLQVCRGEGRRLGDHSEKHRDALPRDLPLPARLETGWRLKAGEVDLITVPLVCKFVQWHALRIHNHPSLPSTPLRRALRSVVGMTLRPHGSMTRTSFLFFKIDVVSFGRTLNHAFALVALHTRTGDWLDPVLLLWRAWSVCYSTLNLRGCVRLETYLHIFIRLLLPLLVKSWWFAPPEIMYDVEDDCTSSYAHGSVGEDLGVFTGWCLLTRSVWAECDPICCKVNRQHAWSRV